MVLFRKTAKSKKKTVRGGDSSTNHASSVASSLPKCEKRAKCESQAKVKQVSLWSLLVWGQEDHSWFTFYLQKEEKSQQQKGCNSASDVTPVLSASSPKPSLSEVLKATTASMATISNIDIDMDEGPGKKELQASPSDVSHCLALNLPVSHNEGSGKPDSSAPPINLPLELKSVSGDVIMEGEECVSRELQLHQEKHTTNDDKTVDVLKHTHVNSPGTALKTYKTVANDTITLLKGASTPHAAGKLVSVPRRRCYKVMILLSLYTYVFKGMPRIYWKAFWAIPCSGEH